MGLALFPSSPCLAVDALPFEPVPAAEAHVPQNLLKLVHTPEVQKELGLQGHTLNSFAKALTAIDGPWWRSRILPDEKQRQIIHAQEAELWNLLKKTMTDTQLKRLQQIELQSQGSRMFARSDLARTIGLSSEQSQKLKELYAKTDAIAKKLTGPNAQDAGLNAELQSAREKELKVLNDTLSEKQKVAFSQFLGEPFDTAKLTRIFPLAPELVASQHWAGGSPTTLSENRGKVVLLHFYAFQCSNCIANFEHYKRWHKDLEKKGVRVIGIQTPETPAERDIKQVQRAAKDRGFEFPVLIDLENKNWDTWANTMWPTVYVIDKNGYIRLWWQGELNYGGATGDKKIEALVEQLLAESP